MEKKNNAIVERPNMILSGKVQQLYNDLIDLKEDIDKARIKRLNALLQNSRYETLKTEAKEIVKEATKIQKEFDAAHPEYKDKISSLAEDAKKVSIGMTRLAIEAFSKGISLEVYRGAGKGKKRVKFNFSCQPSLF